MLNMKYFKLDTVFKFDDDVMEKMNIPKIEQIDSNEELWKFVKLDRHKGFNKERKYLISTYGRLYSLKRERLLKPFNGAKSSNGFYYQVANLRCNGNDVHYFVHRLVALAFIPIDKERPFVNHKDGCPEHNYLWNLEWVNSSENTVHAIKTGLKTEKLGEERSNSLWTDDEIRLVCSMMEEGHKATYIYTALGEILKDPKVEYERVRTLYKHIIHRTHWKHISKDYNIDFSAFNYAKEKGSVKKQSKKKNKKS